jgi:hypothetical protein
MTPSVSTAVLLEKLQSIQITVSRMEGKLDAMDARIHAIEKSDSDNRVLDASNLTMTTTKQADLMAAGLDRETRLKAIERQNYATEATLPLWRVDVNTSLDDHALRLKDIEKLMPWLRVFIWVSSALGISVISLVWSIITGHANIVFR